MNVFIKNEWERATLWLWEIDWSRDESSGAIILLIRLWMSRYIAGAPGYIYKIKEIIDRDYSKEGKCRFYFLEGHVLQFVTFVISDLANNAIWCFKGCDFSQVQHVVFLSKRYESMFSAQGLSPRYRPGFIDRPLRVTWPTVMVYLTSDAY